MKRILRFTAEWCRPCKSMAAILEEVKGDIVIEVIDIDKYSDIAVEFGIRSVPTLVIMDGNIEVKRMTGLKTKNDLENWLVR
jgi:thioredoxin 1